MEECGAVWPTQEQKDFAASSYWRNLGAHDRAKIVQLFLCTRGVGLHMIVIVHVKSVELPESPIFIYFQRQPVVNLHVVPLHPSLSTNSHQW